ncbi:MAG TPA: hypothetical protein VHO70_11550 [Chitinispirillaceae bacterium]|nr:hypothetical protein [Chitinispirillaceae bacterium]
MCIRALIFISIVILIISGCVSTPGELEYVSYNTGHFTINYDDRYFADHEIIAIGEKKEKLLEYLNSTLEVNFNKNITVYLYFKETEYAYVYNGVMYESRDYVLNDDGHEIAHIVSFDKLGHSKNKFMVEGLAVMLEYKTDHYNVIEEYLSYQPSKQEKKSDSITISRQILENRFDYSYYSYRKTGAFLCYLLNRSSMDKLKEFYCISCSVASGELGNRFQDIFGIELSVMEKDFREHLFSDTVP